MWLGLFWRKYVICVCVWVTARSLTKWKTIEPWKFAQFARPCLKADPYRITASSREFPPISPIDLLFIISKTWLWGSLASEKLSHHVDFHKSVRLSCLRFFLKLRKWIMFLIKPADHLNPYVMPSFLNYNPLPVSVPNFRSLSYLVWSRGGTNLDTNTPHIYEPTKEIYVPKRIRGIENWKINNLMLFVHKYLKYKKT